MTENSELTQRRAEILARQFNSAFTNTCAYGPGHPVTQRACTVFAGTLAEVLQQMDALTLMLDRGTLFIEDFSTDGAFNTTRLVNTFRKLGLQSITFDAGLTDREFRHLMIVLGDPDDFPGDQAIRAELATHKVKHIRVNHVVLRKITTDDEVISREGLEDLAGLASRAVSDGRGTTGAGDLEGSVLDRINQVFTLRDLLDQPDQMAGRLLQAADGGENVRASLVAQIRGLSDQVNLGQAEDGKPVALRAVMDALHRMRQELGDTLAGQQETARLMAESGGVLNEVDQLTFQTIVSIVREEHRSGETSAKRLAQIIRRMLPDVRDLKRLLPQLKEGLLAEGMPLPDYIRFVNELTAELQSDDLVQVLEEGADSIGLSVDEIVREIRRDPGEAARLMVLAAELRQGGRPDQDRLSTALTEYIERVSGELAVADAGAQQQAGSLRDSVRTAQQALLARVRTHGVSDTVANRIESDLAHRLQHSVASASSGRVRALLRSAVDIDESSLVDTLGRMVERESDLQTLGETLQQELAAQGFSAERIQSIYTKTAERLKRRSRLELIPGGVLDAETTAFFLQREIKSCKRYATHFSCIMLMIAQVRHAPDAWRTLSPEEIEALMPEVFETLPLQVRDLDLLGMFGSKERNVPLIILPMTDDEGAQIVLQRILAALAGGRFRLDDQEVEARVVGTALRFDPERTADMRSFVQALRGRLATEVVSNLRA